MVKRKNLGFSLFETVISAGITVMVTFAGLTLFITGASNWGRGEQAIAVEDSSRIGLRKAVDELRESMAVTVDADGMGLTFQKPLKDNNGDYVLPVQSDGLNHRLYYSNSNLYMSDGQNAAWIVAHNVITKDPFMLNMSNLNSHILNTDPTAPAGSSSTTGTSNSSGSNNGGSNNSGSNNNGGTNNNGGVNVGVGVGGLGVSVGLNSGGLNVGVNLGSGGAGSGGTTTSSQSSLAVASTTGASGNATTDSISAAPTYAIFVPDGQAVTRSVVIKLVTQTTGGLRSGVISRHREQIYFRNVPTATR